MNATLPTPRSGRLALSYSLSLYAYMRLQGLCVADHVIG